MKNANARKRRKKRPIANKQRIAFLTEKEIVAAESTGGVLDEGIPENEVLRRLREKRGTVFDADRLLSKIRNSVGRYRLFQYNAEADISRADVMRQAKQSAAVIDELLARIQYMHPEIRRICDEEYYALFGVHDVSGGKVRFHTAAMPLN